MLDQAFSSKNLMRLLRKDDVIHYHLGEKHDDYLKNLDRVVNVISKEDFQFAAFQKYKLTHGTVISPSRIEDDFALRKLTDNLQRVFNVKTSDRNSITPQVKVLLAETGEYWLQKLDLKKFFESINKERILSIVNDEPNLSYDSKKYLRKILSHPDVATHPGLPRGISLSSTLSELYMQSFDRACRMLDNCYFYTRYVDDIILLYHEQPKDPIAQLESLLPLGVSLNENKCIFLHRPRKGAVVTSDGNRFITYLGYKFDFEPIKNCPSLLHVGLSERKIKKIKTRVALSLFDYCKTKNYELLKNRIRFLSSNYRIGHDTGSGNLYAGIYYNHSLIDPTRLSDLREIDNFLTMSIFSNTGSLGKKLAPLLTIKQKRELSRLSLLFGHQNKIVRKFEPEQFHQIKSIWRHV